MGIEKNLFRFCKEVQEAKTKIRSFNLRDIKNKYSCHNQFYVVHDQPLVTFLSELHTDELVNYWLYHSQFSIHGP